MKRLIPIAVLCLVQTLALAADPLGIGFQQPAYWIQQTRTYFAAGHYDAASESAQQALVLLQRPPRADHPATVDALVLLGNVFLETGQPDGAWQQYLIAWQLAVRHCGPYHPATADALNGMGECHYRRSELAQAEQCFQQVLKIRTQVFGARHEKTASAINNIGNCLASAALYTEAIEMHRSAWQIRKAVLPPHHPEIAVSLSNLGNCAYLAGRPDSAWHFYQEALQIRRELWGEQHPKTALLHNSIGNCLLAMHRSEEALEHFQTALHNSIATLGPQHPTVATVREHIGDLYFDRGDFIVALDQFRRAWGAQVQVFGEASVSAMTLWHKIGLCRQYQGEYGLALEHHQAALPLLRDALGTQHPSLGAIHNSIGNCHAALQHYPAALQHYRMAQTIFYAQLPASQSELLTTLNNTGAALLSAGHAEAALAAFEKTRPYLAVDAPAVWATFFQNKAAAATYLQRYDLAAKWLKDALPHIAALPPDEQNAWQLSHGELYTKIALQRHDAVELESAAESLYAALLQAGLYRTALDDAQARQVAYARMLPTIRVAMQAFFRLYQQRGNEDFLFQAYQLAEADKSLQWSEISQREWLGESTTLPDSLRQRLRQIHTDIHHWEKERLLMSDPSQQHRAEIQLAELREQWRLLTRSNQQAAQLGIGDASGNQTTDLTSIQHRLLRPDQALIKYFDADSLWLVFVITPKQFRGLALPKSADFQQKVTAFRQSLYEYIGAPMLLADSLARQYAQLATALYDELLAPLDASPAADKKEWVLMPDGAACYLPFEALLSKAPDDAGLFKKHAYLLKKHTISYAYSVAHWAMLEAAPVEKKLRRMAAFAPDFEGHPSGLPPLRHNVEEARRATALLRGRLFEGRDARSDVFLEEAGRYRILLQATHGRAGRSIGDMSYLAFSYAPGDTTAPVVYSRDLYARYIPAELVVLSACETSVGEYRAGEGVVSIAKGFFHAGARSVVATLWSVDDARHADLMLKFLKNISQGERKDEALRRAKLDYISQHPHDEAHPAYWAAATAWGNVRPVAKKRWWWLGK